MTAQAALSAAQMGRAVEVAQREARAALGRWTLAEALATRPPSAVVTLNATDSVGAALTKLARAFLDSAGCSGARSY